jgi:hypothetical protein
MTTTHVESSNTSDSGRQIQQKRSHTDLAVPIRLSRRHSAIPPMQVPSHNREPTPSRRNHQDTSAHNDTLPTPMARLMPNTIHHQSSTIGHHSTASTRWKDRPASMHTPRHCTKSTHRTARAMNRKPRRTLLWVLLSLCCRRATVQQHQLQSKFFSWLYSRQWDLLFPNILQPSCQNRARVSPMEFARFGPSVSTPLGRK